MTYRIVATVVFDSNTGELPSPDEIAKAINDALLARTQGGWSLSYAPEREWKVKYDVVYLREGPNVATPKVGEIYAGEVVKEIGGRDGWVQTARGWIRGDLLEPA